MNKGHSLRQVIFSTILLFFIATIFFLPIFILLLITQAEVLNNLLSNFLSGEFKNIKDLIFPLYVPFIILQALVQTPAYFSVCYYRYLKPFKITWQEFGFSFKNIGYQIKLGLQLWLIFEITALVYDFVLTKIGISPFGPGDPNSFLRNSGFSVLLLMIFSQGFLGAFGEEVFFRGYAFVAMANKYGAKKAKFLSAGLFAVLHGLNYNLGILFIHGLFYATYFEKSRFLMPLIIAHFLKNFTCLIFDYFGIVLY